MDVLKSLRVSFFTRLAEQMIENTLDLISTRSCMTQETISEATVSGIGPHLTSTSRKRKRSHRTVTNAFMQGKRYVCKNGKNLSMLVLNVARGEF